MASAISHAIAALAIGSVAAPRARRLLVVGAVCAVLPDADVIGFPLGIRYGDMLGHRGLSHSLLFAALLASLALLVARPPAARARAWAFLFVATASHGVLDAFTDGGLGVAFFAPFSGTRYFFPWRPIHVSPISVVRFFSERGLAVLASEAVWIWIPAAALVLAGVLARRARDS